MLPLYLDGGTGADNEWMRLFLQNKIPQETQSTTLFINGPVQTTETLPLYINTPSGTEGAFVGRGNMNLYIDRDSEATATRMGLFMANYDTVQSISTFIKGSQVEPSSIQLYIHGSGGPITETTSLFTHGF
jgi:hypothetical protein